MVPNGLLLRCTTNLRSTSGPCDLPWGSAVETSGIGPVLRADVFGSFNGAAPVDSVFTLNLEVGYAYRR
jgi:hypothetical protein